MKPARVSYSTIKSVGDLRLSFRTIENAFGLRKPDWALLVAWLPLLLMFGCERIEGRPMDTLLVASPKTKWPSQDKMVVDLGILFADREQILCFPVEKLGITRADQIRSIVSSCDCISVTTREYTEPDGQTAVALELLHAKTTFGQEPAMRLAVQLAMETTKGDRKCVELICTLAQGGNRE